MGGLPSTDHNLLGASPTVSFLDSHRLRKNHKSGHTKTSSQTPRSHILLFLYLLSPNQELIIWPPVAMAPMVPATPTAADPAAIPLEPHLFAVARLGFVNLLCQGFVRAEVAPEGLYSIAVLSL